MSTSPSAPKSPDTHAEASSPRSQTGTPPGSREPSPSPPHTSTPPESREPSLSQPSPVPATNDPPEAVPESEATAVVPPIVDPELTAPIPERSPNPGRSPSADPSFWTGKPSPNDNALQRAGPLSEHPLVTNPESPRHPSTGKEAPAKAGGRWAGKNKWESSGRWNSKAPQGGNRNMRSQQGGGWNNNTDNGSRWNNKTDNAGGWNQKSDHARNWNNKVDRSGNWNNWKGGAAAKTKPYSGRWSTSRARPDDSAQPSTTSARSNRNSAPLAASVSGRRDEPASSNQPPPSARSTDHGVVVPTKPVQAPAISLDGPPGMSLQPRSSSPGPVPGYLVNGVFQPVVFSTDFVSRGPSRSGSQSAGQPIGLPISARDRRGGHQGTQVRSRVSSSPPGKRVQVDQTATSTRGGPGRLPIARRVSIRENLGVPGSSGSRPPVPRLIPGVPKQPPKTVDIVDLTSTPSSRSQTTTGLQFDGDLATTVATGYSPTVSVRSVSTFTRSGTRHPSSIPRVTQGHGQHQRPFTFPPPAKKRSQVTRNPGDSTPVHMARVYAEQTAAMGQRLSEAERQLNEENIRKEEKRIAGMRRRMQKSLRRRAELLTATADPGGVLRQ